MQTVLEPGEQACAAAPVAPRARRRWAALGVAVLVCAGSIAGALVGSFPVGAGSRSGVHTLHAAHGLSSVSRR